MIRPRKIALDLTSDQAVYFARASGIARFSWNWALGEWQRQYNEWRKYCCRPRPSAESSLAADSLPKGSSATVCGAVSSGLGLAIKVKLAAVKQKPIQGLFVHG